MLVSFKKLMFVFACMLLGTLLLFAVGVAFLFVALRLYHLV